MDKERALLELLTAAVLRLLCLETYALNQKASDEIVNYTNSVAWQESEALLKLTHKISLLIEQLR